MTDATRAKRKAAMRLHARWALVFMFANSLLFTKWGYDGDPYALGLGVFAGWGTLVVLLRWYHDLSRKPWEW